MRAVFPIGSCVGLFSEQRRAGAQGGAGGYVRSVGACAAASRGIVRRRPGPRQGDGLKPAAHSNKILRSSASSDVCRRPLGPPALPQPLSCRPPRTAGPTSPPRHTTLRPAFIHSSLPLLPPPQQRFSASDPPPPSFPTAPLRHRLPFPRPPSPHLPPLSPVSLSRPRLSMLKAGSLGSRTNLRSRPRSRSRSRSRSWSQTSR